MKCNFVKCRHNISGTCCRKSFVDCEYYKAKEIIKKLADDLSMYSGSYQKELLEAEQFLNKSCPDIICEDCKKECPIETIKEIEK